MEKFIEKIKTLKPTHEQLEGKHVHFAFGYVQAINDVIAELKNCNSESVSTSGRFKREDLNPDFIKIIDDIEDKIRR